MKNIITIHHTNGMVGPWTDWDLSEVGMQQPNNIGKNLKLYRI